MKKKSNFIRIFALLITFNAGTIAWLLYNDYDLLRNFRNNIELNAVVSKYLS